MLVVPTWVRAFLAEKFFNACEAHEEEKKNEKNTFCLDCCVSICVNCFSLHRSHRLLQIRRYVYNDVVRLGDAQKLFDCSFVQPYTTNSAKVVFLKHRPQPKQFRGSGNNCATCDRTLQEPYLFCSLSCKIDHISRSNRRCSEVLRDCNGLALPESDVGKRSEHVSIRKSCSESGVYEGVGCKRGIRSCASPDLSGMCFVSRRKNSNPCRSPLY